MRLCLILNHIKGQRSLSKGRRNIKVLSFQLLGVYLIHERKDETFFIPCKENNSFQPGPEVSLGD